MYRWEWGRQGLNPVSLRDDNKILPFGNVRLPLSTRHTSVVRRLYRDIPKADAMQMPKSTFNPVILIVWSLWMLWGFGYQTVWLRLVTECEGIVTSSQDIPPTRGPRYATRYMVLGLDGQSHICTAGPTEASLPRSMPVSTRIKKQRWHLGFERNGQQVNDFSVFFYSLILMFAIASLFWGLRSWYQGQLHAENDRLLAQ